MGVNKSTIKTLTEHINKLKINCGHSDCKSKCGSCFELEIDTAHDPTQQYREKNMTVWTQVLQKLLKCIAKTKQTYHLLHCRMFGV